MKTPCDIPDYDGVYRCPYSEDPTSETCRCYCGLGVDEDYEEDYEDENYE